MNRSTYTVRDIAEIISGSKEPDVIARVSRQIRYWTTEDILKPLGGKRTGSGRHRKYDANEVRKAALMDELARYGISAVRFDPFGEFLDDFMDSSQWEDAVLGKDDVFFIHAEECGIGGGNMGRIERRDLSFLIKLLTSREKQKIHDYNNFPSALVINLTKLFAKLQL